MKLILTKIVMEIVLVKQTLMNVGFVMVIIQVVQTVMELLMEMQN